MLSHNKYTDISCRLPFSFACLLQTCLYPSASTGGPSLLSDAVTWGLNVIADTLANIAGFCILILTMFSLAPFGKTNSLWNQVAPQHKHTLLHVYEIFFLFIYLPSLMQSGIFKIARVLLEQSPINLRRDSIFSCILFTILFYAKCKSAFKNKHAH